MKKHYLLSMVLTLLLLAGSSVFSQNNTIAYAYDAAGNRVLRTIYMPYNAPIQKSVATDPIQDENTTVLTEDLGNFQLKIYPNPTKGRLIVELSGDDTSVTGTVAVYSINGNLIQQKMLESNTTIIDLSAQPSGNYLMKVAAGTQNTTWKIVKE